MPVQSNMPLKQVDSRKKSSNAQTPPPKKKPAKNERASLLCSTPPTCIKDRDSHVEYTRKEFLGEVVHPSTTDKRADSLDAISLQTVRVVPLPQK
jgi:hypothetical protein